MRSQLERAINLAAKTGDKIIVVDELNDRSLAVMNLDEYEKLLNGEHKGNLDIKNLTEEELLDKINRDIVTWKDANENKKFLAENPVSEDDFEEDSDVFSDFNAEGDLIPEDKENEEEIKKETDENLYYYNEPAPPFIRATENEKEEAGFTSIKDELKKNRKVWEIPAEAKEAAEDVIF